MRVTNDKDIMLEKRRPWDQKLADMIIPYLIGSSISPNQITFLSMMLALLGATFLAMDGSLSANIGALLFIIARFLDHIDGELARNKMMASKFGYYLDYATGGISFAALFVAMGIKHETGFLGHWSIFLGSLGALSAIICLFLNLQIDKKRCDINENEGESIGYPNFLGFELEDGIYLLAPITWLNWLEPFFILASIGAIFYGFWTLFLLARVKNQ